MSGMSKECYLFWLKLADFNNSFTKTHIKIPLAVESLTEIVARKPVACVGAWESLWSNST